MAVPSWWEFVAGAAGDLGNAAAGKLRLFFDVATGLPAVKDESGTVTSLQGATGDTGAGYGGTSTTSLLIEVASKAFTTQAGLAYLAGGRVRASSAADVSDFMEGVVASYSGTTLTVAVDLIGGSGTHADWNLNAAGEPGASSGALHWASVKRTTNLSTPFDYYDSGATGFSNNGVVEFDTEEEDTDGFWAIGAPTKLVISAAIAALGLPVRLTANAIWQNDLTTYAEAKVFKNGNLTEPVAVAQIAVATNNTAPILVTRPLIVEAGDYFELCLRSGDAATVLAAVDYSTTFSIEVVGGAGPTGPDGADGADGLGVPAGGTTGQLLAKASNADNDTEWVDPAGASLQSARYIRSAGDYSTTSATFVDVDATNMALTITTGAKRCLVGFVGSAYNNNAGGAVGLTVAVDGVDQGDASFGLLYIHQHATASEQNNGSFVYLTDVLTAASHTFKLRFFRGSAGTAIISGSTAGAGPQCEFWVQEIG